MCTEPAFSQPKVNAMNIQILGCSGAATLQHHTTSFLIDQTLLVDAGTGATQLSVPQMAAIEHVVITHCHLDHIAGLPLLLDTCASLRQKPLHVWGLPQTIDALKTHIFNDVIWPDFCKIPNAWQPLLQLHTITQGQCWQLGAHQVQALPATHSVPAVGYAVAKADAIDSPWWVFSGDTCHDPAFWQRVNGMNVGLLFIEVAFGQQEHALAGMSQHHCPSTLVQTLALMNPLSTYPIGLTHTKPAEHERIEHEVMQQLAADPATCALVPRMRWLASGQAWACPIHLRNSTNMQKVGK
jgi:ribonuclease BN (tRNA processing enzyme)